MTRRNNMFKALVICIALYAISSCSVPPYDDEGLDMVARKAENFAEFSYVIEGQKIYGVRSGDENKPPVLFVHGAPGDWKAWGDYIADRDLYDNFNIIAIDRPGYGGSDPGNWEVSLKAQTKAIIESAAKENKGPFIIVGHSFGGPIVLQALLDYPELIKSGVILAGSIDPELETVKWFQTLADSLLLNWAVPEPLNVANKEILPLKKELSQQQPYLKNINHKIIVIQGEDDDLVPPGNADYAKQLLAGADLEIIRLKNQGHFLPWEQYELIKATILSIE